MQQFSWSWCNTWNCWLHKVKASFRSAGWKWEKSSSYPVMFENSRYFLYLGIFFQRDILPMSEIHISYINSFRFGFICIYLYLFIYLYCFCFILPFSIWSKLLALLILCFILPVNVLVSDRQSVIWWVCTICDRQKLPWLCFRWLKITIYILCHSGVKNRVNACLLKEAKETNWQGVDLVRCSSFDHHHCAVYGIFTSRQWICNFSEKWMGTTCFRTLSLFPGNKKFGCCCCCC